MFGEWACSGSEKVENVKHLRQRDGGYRTSRHNIFLFIVCMGWIITTKYTQ